MAAASTIAPAPRSPQGFSAITIGTFGGPGTGTVTNAGTITQTAAFGGDVVALLSGGTVTNLQGGVISAQNGSNAVSVGQGNTRTVINSGTIANTGTGFATGVLVQGGARTVINNATGRISGTFNGVFSSSDAPLILTNKGLIESTGLDASARAVEADAGGTVVNTGIIRSASSDGLYLGDASTVTNSGTISGSALAINFANSATNTLTLDTGSVLNGNVQGGGGINNLTLIGTGTESIAKFLNFQTLSMQGAAWTLTGNGTFSTSATIQSGTLLVNGQLTSPVVMVQSGGTLGGIGTIVGADDSGVRWRACSGQFVKPDRHADHHRQSRLSVRRALSGAGHAIGRRQHQCLRHGDADRRTVNAQFASGSYLAKQYTILRRPAGLAARHSRAWPTPTCRGRSDSLSYDGNSVYLNLNAGLTNTAGSTSISRTSPTRSTISSTTGGIPPAFFG